MDAHTIEMLLAKNSYNDNVRFECFDGSVFQWSGDHFSNAYNEFIATGKTRQELKTVVLETYITQLLNH